MGPIKDTVSAAMSHQKTPLILTIVSCTGVVVTAVMVARAAPKAHHILEEEKAERLRDRLPIGVMIKKTWKLYLPAVAVGAVTIGSIVTMNRVSARNATILSASAALATNTLRDYQSHVLEEIGSEKESKIRTKMAKRTLENTELSDETANLILSVGRNEGIALDSITGRYFGYSGMAEDIRKIENDLNHEMVTLGRCIPLNELYEALGLDPVPMGETMGFNRDNMIDIHFAGALTKKDQPVLVLSYINLPVTGFDTDF